MTDLRKAAQQALEAMQNVNHANYSWACVEAITALREALAQPDVPDGNEADELLRNLGLDPDTYRTDGGYINYLKVKAAIRNPEGYPQKCAHVWEPAPAALGGNLCARCGTPEKHPTQDLPAQAGSELVGVVESATAGCDGFHVRKLPGQLLPRVGQNVYTHPPARTGAEPAPSAVVCGRCDGTGLDARYCNYQCEKCDGSGQAGAEPVAWMYFDSDGDSIFGHPNGYRPDDAVPVYTHPPARVPLTKTRVGNYLRRHVHGEVGMYRNGFKDGVAFAEAAHGIGGGK